tara:strand:- start:1560 stop:3893 length:2334 start_codon:yes stop_codon:yes gene_type:complete
LTDELNINNRIISERYIVGDLLGGTAIAYVHKAYDKQTLSEVAIKFLRPYFINEDNAELISNYFNFLESIKKSNSNVILAPIDYSSDKNSIWVVYPYMNFKSLDEIIRGKQLPLNIENVISIVNKTTEALESIHEIDIVHGNLKPSNILVSEDFQTVKIEGFYMYELSQNVNELTQSSLNVPHPYYSSSEHCKRISLDKSSDVYALASIAYQLLFGVLPFLGTRESVVYYKSISLPKLPSEIRKEFTPEVDSVFLKALNKRPTERFFSCRDFTNAFIESLKDIVIPSASNTNAEKEESDISAEYFSEYVCVYCGQQNTPMDTLCRGCWSPLTKERFTTVESAERKEKGIIRSVKLNRFTRWSLIFGFIVLISWGTYSEFFKPPPLVPIASTSVLTAVSQYGDWALHGRNLENWSSVDTDQFASLSSSRVKGEIEWIKDTGKPIIASSSIKDGILIIPTSADKILALDPYTGDKIWEFETSGPIDSSPTITDKTTYVGLRDGRMLAINTSNGELIWEFDSEDPIMSSPLVFKGAVFFGTGNGSMFSLDAVNGDYLWHFESDGWITNTPVVNNDTVVFSNSRAWVYVIDTKTGTARLTYNTYGKNISGPVLIDDNVLLGLGNGKLLAINTRMKEYRFERKARFWRLQFYLWGFEDKPPVQKGFSWSSRVARSDTGLTDLSVQEDKVYFGTSNGYAYAHDLMADKTLWQTEVGIGVSASPIAVGDQIFIGTNDGLVHSLDRTSGEIEWTVKTEAGIKAKPTWANGFLYVSSTDGKLYAIR